MIWLRESIKLICFPSIGYIIIVHLISKFWYGVFLGRAERNTSAKINPIWSLGGVQIISFSISLCGFRIRKKPRYSNIFQNRKISQTFFIMDTYLNEWMNQHVVVLLYLSVVGHWQQVIHQRLRLLEFPAQLRSQELRSVTESIADRGRQCQLRSREVECSEIELQRIVIISPESAFKNIIPTQTSIN